MYFFVFNAFSLICFNLSHHVACFLFVCLFVCLIRSRLKNIYSTSSQHALGHETWYSYIICLFCLNCLFLGVIFNNLLIMADFDSWPKNENLLKLYSPTDHPRCRGGHLFIGTLWQLQWQFKVKTTYWWICFLQTHNFSLNKTFIDGLESCG